MGISLRLILSLLGAIVILAIVGDCWLRARKRARNQFSGARRRRSSLHNSDAYFAEPQPREPVYSFDDEPSVAELPQPHFQHQPVVRTTYEERASHPIEPPKPMSPAAVQPEPEYEEEPEIGVKPTGQPLVVVLHVMAQPGQVFVGSKLLPLFSALNLKHGNRQIFHRHKEANGKGEILFSLASAVKPGVFDLANIDQFTTPGISLFMALPGVTQPVHAFDLMVQVARQLAAHLHGRLEDNYHEILTAETLAFEREKVQNYVQRSLEMI